MKLSCVVRSALELAHKIEWQLFDINCHSFFDGFLRF